MCKQTNRWMDGWINRQTISYNRNYIATTTTTHDGTPHCATQQQHNITLQRKCCNYKYTTLLYTTDYTTLRASTSTCNVHVRELNAPVFLLICTIKCDLSTERFLNPENLEVFHVEHGQKNSSSKSVCSIYEHGFATQFAITKCWRTHIVAQVHIHVSRTKSTQRVHAKRVTIFHPRSQFILDGGPTAPFKSFRKFISYRCRSSLLIALGPAPKQKESQLRGNYEAFGGLKHFSHIRKQEYVISKNSSVTNAACQPSNRLLFVPVFSSIAACRVEVPRSKDVGSERNGDVHLH